MNRLVLTAQLVERAAAEQGSFIVWDVGLGAAANATMVRAGQRTNKSGAPTARTDRILLSNPLTTEDDVKLAAGILTRALRALCGGDSLA